MAMLNDHRVCGMDLGLGCLCPPSGQGLHHTTEQNARTKFLLEKAAHAHIPCTKELRIARAKSAVTRTRCFHMGYAISC